MRRLPTRLVVGPFTYLVTRTSKGMKKNMWGHHIPRSREIHVAPDLLPIVERETVLHELTHACWDVAGLGFSEVKDHEEYVVTALATALFDVLRRNPGLVRYLIERDKENP